MMEPETAASPPASPPASPHFPRTGHGPDTRTKPLKSDRGMVFFRRPDLSGRQLFFQNGGGSTRQRRADSASSERSVPVQLIGIDGKSQIGVAAAPPSSRFSEVSVAPGDSQRRQRESRLSRLLVTSDVLQGTATKRRLRQVKLLVVGVAIASFVLTASMLFPSNSHAWFHVDAFDSALGPMHTERVKALRPALLLLSLGTNVAGIAATWAESDSLLMLYIYGMVVSDVWTLTSLLPHAFFFLRLLFDVLPVLLAIEARSYLTQQWFVTNFHRLRF